jgi:uncharacterized protein (TIGR02246 family)
MSGPEIAERERQWLSSFNRGDASALARFYADNGRILSSRAGIILGRAAIEAFYKGLAAMGASLTLAPLTVHESGDLGAAVGTWEMEMHPDGQDAQSDGGNYVVVWARQADGSWLIVEDISNSTPAARDS